MLLKTPVRADARALAGAVAVGAAMGLLLAGSYLAGGAARATLAHARTARLAAAASSGFSDAALRTEAADMESGALAVARRHDPFTVAGAPQRDRETAMLAARLEQPSRAAVATLSADAPARPLLLRAGYPQPAAPARPFRMASINPLDGARELDCLSDAIYYEARGESSDGQEAVAQVVLNRVRHPAFPKSVCGVVFQGAQVRSCQFSFACDGAMREEREPAAWRRAQSVAARALGGFVMAEVGDATHFHVARLGSLWSDNLLKVAQVGAHIFYRFTGRAGAPSVFRAAPDLYVPPSELADKPVFGAGGADTADGASAPALILASAVTTPPLGQGGPLGAPTAPASAQADSAKAAGEKPANLPAATPATVKTPTR